MIIDISEDGRTIEWWSNGERKIATIYQLIDAYDGIVRCKECKHLMTYNDGTYDCKYLVEKMFAEGELNNKPNDFCCWGERKEVEE